MWLHPAAQVGEDRTIALTMKKRPSELVLQLTNYLGQRGLRDVASLVGACEILDLSDCEEIPDLMHFHSYRPLF
jgi:hypothetical protein